MTTHERAERILRIIEGEILLDRQTLNRVEAEIRAAVEEEVFPIRKAAETYRQGLVKAAGYLKVERDAAYEDAAKVADQYGNVGDAIRARAQEVGK